MIDLSKFIDALAYGAWFIVFLSGIFGVLIGMKGVYMIPKINDPMGRHREVTAGHCITTCAASLFMLGQNLVTMAAMYSIGAEQSDIYNAQDILSIGASSQANTEQLKVTLAMMNMARVTGIWSGYIAGLNIQHVNHPDEMIRKNARLRAGWGFGVSIILIYPAFWIKVFAEDFPMLRGIANLTSQL